ncbi:kinase-like protein [Penicillium coprophilum]|uniref:kinase-like protein n=1 Tax=Penicillium coprophilum TaxID=36646 RepID=UPI00238A632E|nr:kinase-like protein [Penicillium coprophilum]KAJ5154915.1 kinase-like protein [Penicillium coprophilum]
MQHFSRGFSYSRLLPKSMSSLSGKPDLFEYTSGRFLFNEDIRRSERHIEFDVNALTKVACHSVGRPLNGVASITKLTEGGFNRVLQVTFNNGYTILIRLPYKTTVPKHYTVTSEAATLALLRAYKVLVPKVLVYSSDQTNAVGTEYTLLEKLKGTPLSYQWLSIDTKTRVKIVDIERRLISIHFLVNGSLYYRHDLDALKHLILVSDDIVVGLTV